MGRVQVTANGERLKQGLQKALADNKHVKVVRGLGLIVGVQLDQVSSAPQSAASSCSCFPWPVSAPAVALTLTGEASHEHVEQAGLNNGLHSCRRAAWMLCSVVHACPDAQHLG